jgi:fatty acid desaturase
MGGRKRKRAMSKASLRLARLQAAVPLLLTPVVIAIGIVRRDWEVTALLVVSWVVVALIFFQWLRHYEPQPNNWIWKRRR